MELQPIVFLHGFMGSGADWREICELLAEDYYCVCPDLPGHGANTVRDFEAQLALAGLASELQALCAGLGPKAPFVVGYSLGGRVALHAALLQPSRMKALVLESASPGLEGALEREARLATDDARSAALLANGLPAFTKSWYATPLFQSLHRYPMLLAKLQAARAANDARWLAKVVRELSPGRAASGWAGLASIQTRTLLVAGALDVSYSAIVQRMAASMPTATMLIMPDAGHNVHLEEPVAYAQALRKFMASCV
jgi:2-succinyl-6-hydroxy-2,4-cyclohexadiene-1-carboxylate synthase